jgi:hypothetical protein
MSLLAHLAAHAIGNRIGNKMEKRMLEMLDKYKAHLDASSEKNIELENWLEERKKK